MFMHNMPCSCTTCQCSCTTCQCSCTTCQCSCTMSMFMHNMPMFMHNMPMFMHNMPSCKHNISSCKHNILTAWTKCQHDICTHNMPTRTVNIPTCDMQCNMPLCRHNMHARSACALQPPGTAQRSKFMMSPWGFPSTRSWKRLLKLLRSQARLETNIRDWQMAEPLPACQGPWGTLHQISRRLPVRVSRTVCRNRLGKVMLVAVNFCRPGATVPI